MLARQTGVFPEEWGQGEEGEEEEKEEFGGRWEGPGVAGAPRVLPLLMRKKRGRLCTTSSWTCWHPRIGTYEYGVLPTIAFEYAAAG